MSEARVFIPAAKAQSPLFVGVDLGGTNIKIGVVDDLGRPLSWLSVPTEVEIGPEAGAQRMGQGVLDAVAKAGLKPTDIGRVGLGTPGTMDIPAGKFVNPPNLPGWDFFPIRDRVSGHCGLPVSFVNDANAAAYGEFWVGSGKMHSSLVMFTLGTGVGGGIIIGDVIIEGEHSAGGELGHVIIDCNDDALVCSCGKTGHLEAYASATAVVKRIETALQGGFKSSLATRLDRGEELTPLMLAAEAEKGDELSIKIVMDTAMYLGVGVVSLMHTIDPAAVVFGGAMTFGGHETELGRKFLARVKEEVRKRAFPVLAEKTAIDFASLGGDAGYVGAAGIARLAYKRLAK